MVDIVRRTEDLVRDLIESEGYDLVHVEFFGSGHSAVLRLYVDRAGGITVSECAEISRRVSLLLDVEDYIPGSYTLEVSSPGIERPLFRKVDYERHIGEEVKLVTTQKVEGRRNFNGYVLKVFEKSFSLDCDGKVYDIEFSNLKKANLVYKFD